MAETSSGSACTGQRLGSTGGSDSSASNAALRRQQAGLLQPGPELA
jgi:hypothetical protein